MQTWTSITLPPDREPLPSNKLAELIADMRRMDEADRTDLLRSAMRLASDERALARQEHTRAKPANIKISEQDMLDLVRFGGSLAMGYRMLRCMDGDDAAPGLRAVCRYVAISLHDELLSQLPDGSVALGDILTAAVTAFRAAPPSDLEALVRRNEAQDWGLRRAKEKTYGVNARITPAVEAYLHELGKGNTSRGARAILRWVLERAK